MSYITRPQRWSLRRNKSIFLSPEDARIVSSAYSHSNYAISFGEIEEDLLSLYLFNTTVQELNVVISHEKTKAMTSLPKSRMIQVS